MTELLFKTTTFADAHEELLLQLTSERAVKEKNRRTGHEIAMLHGGVSFKLDLSEQLLPLSGTRKLFPHIAAAETAWFIQANPNIKWLQQYCKAWDKFVDCGSEVVSAQYGFRWRKSQGRDQLALAIEALRKNPTDRRVFVSAWDPRQDGLGAEGQVNVPCPVGFTFSMAEDFLHSSLFIRSSDVFVGLPYDVMGHAMLMGVVAASVGAAGLGTMHVTLAHPHLYDSHYGMAETMLRADRVVGRVPIFARTLTNVEQDPDGFVWAYRSTARQVPWPSFNPSPEIIQ